MIGKEGLVCLLDVPERGTNEECVASSFKSNFLGGCLLRKRRSRCDKPLQQTAILTKFSPNIDYRVIEDLNLTSERVPC